MKPILETFRYLSTLQAMQPALSAQDLLDLRELGLLERRYPFPILRVPAHKLIDHVGIAYASTAHYHRTGFAEHLASTRPKSLGEVLTNAGPLAAALATRSRWHFASGMPWSTPERFGIAEQLHRDGNCAHFGPCTPEFIAGECRRLQQAADSLARHGYRPFRFPDGFIRGFIVSNGSTYNLIVTAGKHRAAAACAAAQTVQVRLEWNHFLPVVRRGDAARLPQVLAGNYSADLARDIIDYYCGILP